jgi:hypothetical protein
MDEYIWPVFTSDESVALGVVEPLDFAFVLSHRLAFLADLVFGGEQGTGKCPPIPSKTPKPRERLILLQNRSP